MRPKSLIEITGRTQGMTFKIKPPRKANRRIKSNPSFFLPLLVAESAEFLFAAVVIVSEFFFTPPKKVSNLLAPSSRNLLKVFLTFLEYNDKIHSKSCNQNKKIYELNN